MGVFLLDEQLWFPPVEEAIDDGLLAVGGDLSTERLLLAYRSGIFPWFSDDVPMWWSPHPRFVLFPEELKISKSMKPVLRNGQFSFSTNKAFREVITNCRQSDRSGQDGTWITGEMLEAYTQLHERGVAHSAETWMDSKLVGGLYGIRLGKMFFGESMFSQVSNASKYAFIKYVRQLQTEGVELIDCQVYTEHLESLGARMIERVDFMERLNRLVGGL